MTICTYCKKDGRIAAKGFCGTCYARYQRNGTAEYVRPNRSFGVTKCCHCYSETGPFIRNYCRSCYQRQYKNGTPEIARTRRICEVPGCDDPVVTNGLCNRHRQRLARRGDVNAGRPVGWGQRTKHPMYEAWQSMRRSSRGSLDPRWDDFWLFLEDVGERPSAGWRLYRLDTGAPFSRTNVEWRGPVLDEGARKDRAAYQRAYRVKRPTITRRAHLRRNYGIDDRDYQRMSDAQGGRMRHLRATRDHDRPEVR